MKKLTIILLALAMAAFAVPAFAGDISVNGTYQFDGEDYTGQGDTKDQWYDDELRVNLNVTQGPVKVFVGLEVSDDETFDGTNNVRSSEIQGTTTTNDIVNDYYVEWAARDDMKVKIGEYGLSFARKVVVYADPAAHQIGFTYGGLSNVDLGLYLSKVVEAGDDDDSDHDAISLTASVKGVEFFKKLDFIYITGSADDMPATAGTDEEASYGYMGFDTAFMAGPVAVALEYGSVSDDVEANEASFTYAELGFDELAGFDINLEIFDSSEDGNLEGRFGANDYFPLMIYGFRGGFGTLSGIQLVNISGSYKINDQMTFIGKVMAMGKDKNAADEDALGMEIDAHLKYKFADNVSATFTYATWSPGDGAYADGDTETDMRARFDFAF